MARKKTPVDILTDYIWDNRITASELARRLGITPQHLSDLRASRRPPSLVVAARIERVVGISAASWVSCGKSTPAA